MHCYLSPTEALPGRIPAAATYPCVGQTESPLSPGTSKKPLRRPSQSRQGFSGTGQSFRGPDPCTVVTMNPWQPKMIRPSSTTKDRSKTSELLLTVQRWATRWRMILRDVIRPARRMAQGWTGLTWHWEEQTDIMPVVLGHLLWPGLEEKSEEQGQTKLSNCVSTWHLYYIHSDSNTTYIQQYFQAYS